MANEESQISATVSPATRDLLERYVRETGRNPGHVVEQALLHHLQALQEIPDEVVIPPRLVLTEESGMDLLAELEKGSPSQALRKLMRDGD